MVKQYNFENMLDNISKYKILLASKSPRRKELLEQLQLPFEVIAVDVDEVYPDVLESSEVPEYLSRLKCDALINTLRDDELVITADTVVILDGKIYGKPENKEDAKRMLRELSGKTHQVVTGVCVATKRKQISFRSVTDVEFALISDDDIEYYVDKFNPVDKAGAYGIQEWIGCVAVKSLNGSFYNVMGLPVHRLYEELKKF